MTPPDLNPVNTDKKSNLRYKKCEESIFSDNYIDKLRKIVSEHWGEVWSSVKDRHKGSL